MQSQLTGPVSQVLATHPPSSAPPARTRQISPTPQVPGPALQPTVSPQAALATDHEPLKQLATLRPLPAQSSYAQIGPEAKQDEPFAGGVAGQGSAAVPPLPPTPSLPPAPAPPPAPPEVLVSLAALLVPSSVAPSPMPTPPFPVAPELVPLPFVVALAALVPLTGVPSLLVLVLALLVAPVVLVVLLELLSADPSLTPSCGESSAPQPPIQPRSVHAAIPGHCDAERRCTSLD